MRVSISVHDVESYTITKEEISEGLAAEAIEIKHSNGEKSFIFLYKKP